jgi:hypothetical protein
VEFDEASYGRGEGFRFMHIHFWFFGMIVRHLLMVARRKFWNLLVGLRRVDSKLLSVMKFMIFEWYSWASMITMEEPLSALVMMALLVISLSFIDRIVQNSCLALGEFWGFLALHLTCRCCMWVAICWQMPSCSCAGKWVTAVSASSANV